MRMSAVWLRRLLGLALLAVLGLGGWIAGRQAWAEYHLRAAQGDQDARRFPAAREHLAACLSVRPNSIPVHFLAARVARRESDFATAEDHIDRCQALGGVTPDVQLERALIQVQQGDLDTLIPQLRTLVEDGHPDRLLILEAAAIGYTRGRRMEEALGCLRRWLELEPDDTTALALRARIYDENKSYQNAINDYEHILRVDSDNDAARFGLANALLAFKQPKEAFRHFQILKERAYPKPDVLAGLARCQQELGEIDEARTLFDELLTAYPDHAPALTERAKIALADKDTDKAESLLRRALKYDPAYREAHYALYLCLKQAGKEKEAAEQNIKRIQVEADLTRWFALMNHEIPHDPQNPELMVEAAWICLRNSEPDGAIFWLRRALHYDPNHRPTHEALAEYYEKAGQPEQAAAHRKLAAPSQGPAKEAAHGAAR
jgi:tetratricopeptide (TPR) repeat protein